VALSRLRGRVEASWFDPTSGQSTSVEGSPFDNQGGHGFTAPGKNSAGEGDWVLVLETSTRN
jgi:hypothetical protein